MERKKLVKEELSKGNLKVENLKKTPKTKT